MCVEIIAKDSIKANKIKIFIAIKTESFVYTLYSNPICFCRYALLGRNNEGIFGS